MSQQEPRPRRGRPPRLSADAIVDAATGLIEDTGLEGFSMRALAERLEVWPMAIYNHFENKEAILDAVADRFLGSVEIPPPEPEAWDRWLVAFAETLREGWTSQPRLLAVVMSRPGRGESIARILDTFLGVLGDAGFSAELAHGAWHALQNHLFGEVYQQAYWGAGQTEEDREQRLRTLDRRDPESYPNLREWQDVLVACDRKAEFRVGLDLIVSGLRERVTHDASPPP